MYLAEIKGRDSYGLINAHFYNSSWDVILELCHD